MADEHKLKERYPMYLAGRAAESGSWLGVSDKYTSKEATRVSLASPADIDRAIAAAVESQEELRGMASYERKEVLLHVARRLRERREELAFVLCVEAGKPISDARGEIDRAVVTYEAAAEEAVRVYGEYAPLDISAGSRGYQSVTRRFPIGPVSMVSPFNFPHNLAAHKIAPAIAAGCPWVLKPASRTPVSALLIGEILAETRLPAASWSILPCSRDGADLFTTDERFKLLSFTGSPEVGWALKARCGKKKCVLELGGNAACVVTGSADVDDAVARVVHGGYYQSGQSCIGVQRLYVHESVYDAFVPLLAERVRALRSGDPKDPAVFIGPMISAGDAARMDEWTQEALGKGARLLAGGKRDGVFFDATLVEDVPRGCRLRDEEAFGPVVCVERYADFKAVVAEVNDSKFGLQAGVFTNNFNEAFYAFDRIEAGGVVINDVPSKRVDTQAYGGVKDSGLGREGLRYAIEDMTEPRVMLLRNAGQL